MVYGQTPIKVLRAKVPHPVETTLFRKWFKWKQKQQKKNHKQNIRTKSSQAKTKKNKQKQKCLEETFTHLQRRIFLIAIR